MLKRSPRIDMHSHYFSNSYYKLLEKYDVTHPDNVFVPKWSLEKHLSDMEYNNIVYTCLSITSPFFSFVKPNEVSESVRRCNTEGAEIAVAHPDKVGLLAALPLPDIRSSVEEIEYCVTQLGVKGFSLPTHANGVYMGNPMLDPVFEVLNRYGALVTLHPTTPASVPKNVNETLPIPLFEFFVDTARTILNMVYRDIFKRFPAIRFVMPHAGGCFSTMTGRLSSGGGASLDIVGNMQHMYFDLAGCPVPVQLRELLELVGEDRLVYGIDFPYASRESALNHGDSLDSTELLTEEKRQKIYIDNAKNLLNL